MANSKVPQFGSWAAEENVGYTAYFETARKGKSGGPMINPNDPQMNSELVPQARPAGAPQATKPESKQPKFGQWEAEEEEVPYTAYFENTRKGNKTNPNDPHLTNPNDPQMNRDVPPQARPAAKKPEQKQPKFGEWEADEEVPYTAYFDNAGKGNKRNPNEPQMNRDVPRARPAASPPRPVEQKQPKFGEWEDGEEVPYTAYFENTGKGTRNPNEPEMNRDVGASVEPKHAPSAASATARPSAVKFQSPLHPRTGGGGSSQPSSFDSAPGAPGRVAQKPPARGPNNQPIGGGGASIPAFGGWNNNPGQAENYTVVFDQHQKDRRDGPGGATPTRDGRTTPARAPIQKPKNSKVLQLGSRETEDSVGYTAYIEMARQGKSGGSVIRPNEPWIDRDLPLPPAHPGGAPQRARNRGGGEDVHRLVQAGVGCIRSMNAVTSDFCFRHRATEFALLGFRIGELRR